MGISSDEISTHGDENHGVRDIDALFVVTHEAPPSCHPSEGSLDHPASGQDLEALLVVGSPYDLNDEIEVGSLVHQLQPIIGAIGEQVLYPGPAFADAIEDGLGAALSEISAVVRLTIKSRPSVSTAMWRLRPTIFSPASYPLV